MPVPNNSIPMVGGQGPFDYITMGGLFTVLKVREGIASYEDPAWYKHPEGTVATVASDDELKRDGIELPKDLSKSAPARRPVPNEAWCGVPPAKAPLLTKNEAATLIKAPQ
jgi:hypothetical protein